jgi:hypothetical protein
MTGAARATPSGHQGPLGQGLDLMAALLVAGGFFLRWSVF